MRSTLHLPNALRRTNPRHAPAPRHRGPRPQRPPSPPLPRPRLDASAGRLDRDACKVREAGGPLDQAAYVCLCGFAFAAAVSTSVECPHCGSPQAW